MTEHERARAWRIKHELSWEQLSELSGYGRSTLYWFERGVTPPNRSSRKHRKIDPFVWQRYRLVMAAVDHQLRSGNVGVDGKIVDATKIFNWGSPK